MKIKIIAGVLSLSIVIGGGIWMAKPANAAGAEISHQVVQIPVAGMTCQGCANKVKSAVESINGVSACEVDLSSGRISVTGQLSEAATGRLLEAIKSMGFKPGDSVSM
ncbi:MAG: copper chaperone [Candidatus Marinamargulisbacteria bacterium]|jgi:copper chaperone